MGDRSKDTDAKATPGKRATGDQPDFTPADLSLIDGIWDRLGKRDRLASVKTKIAAMPGPPKPPKRG